MVIFFAPGSDLQDTIDVILYFRSGFVIVIVKTGKYNVVFPSFKRVQSSDQLCNLPYHPGRYISLHPALPALPALSLVGIVEIVSLLVKSLSELKYFYDVATPALLCHKEPVASMHRSPLEKPNVTLSLLDQIQF